MTKFKKVASFKSICQQGCHDFLWIAEVKFKEVHKKESQVMIDMHVPCSWWKWVHVAVKYVPGMIRILMKRTFSIILLITSTNRYCWYAQ